MNKIAAYEMLLEDHPLWEKSAKATLPRWFRGTEEERAQALSSLREGSIGVDDLKGSSNDGRPKRLVALEAGDRLSPSEKKKFYALMTGGMGLVGAGAAAATKKDIPAGLLGGLGLGGLSSAISHHGGKRRNRRRDELRRKGLY